MSAWKPKRFWTAATVVPAGAGFTVALDGRPVRTPAKAPLILPTRGLAEAVAAEWAAQEGEVDPGAMPFTRSANAAIDKVARQFDEVAEMVAAYGDTDLLCYRADAPEALARRQSEAWDPALDWAARVLGARLVPRRGILHRPQAAEALDRLSRRVRAATPFQLTALHDLVGLSGSLVLGLAAAEGWKDADAIWTLSRLDELWQEEHWGCDEEAQAGAAHRRAAFLHAKRFFDLAGNAGNSAA